MTDAPWVFCGTARLGVPRADAFEPPARGPQAEDLAWSLECALHDPLGAPSLRHLARGAASVAITVPDASRPCPTPPVLEYVLDELNDGGVPDGRIIAVIGCGLHATTTARERDAVAGTATSERIEVVDAQGIESEQTDLGTTSLGAPIRIARHITGADLVVTVGIVEPHLYAGFSGGVKGVAIGCAGQETIAWTHRPAFVSQPGVDLGRLTGNPFQETLVEIAARTPLRWAVNLVMDENGGARAVLAGDPVGVQRSLARSHRQAWLRPVSGPFDVLVAGVHAPKSDSLYQASRAATYAGLAARPAVADGGLIVLCADLPQGAGTGPGEQNFLEVLAAAASADELVARGLREPLGPGGQRSFVVARVLQRFRLAVVGGVQADLLAPLEHLGVAAFDSVDAALAAEDARLGRRARVLAVADAMATVVHAA